MSSWIRIIITALALTVWMAFAISPASGAEQDTRPELAGSPYDLINAVNVLRAAYRLPPYRISPILMYTAQSQADFLAATGTMTHAGPGGVGLTERLLAAGYPLAGDLTAGGFRAENITGGDESMPAEDAVERWTGDALHLNTMISASLTEIGAGVAVSGGRVYYVIDCALPTTSTLPQNSSSAEGEEPAASARGSLTIPVVVSTPDSNGDVFHEVQSGAFTETPTGPVNALSTMPPRPTDTAIALVMIPTQSLTPPATSTNNSGIVGVMIGIIVLALLGGGLLTWLGSSRKS